MNKRSPHAPAVREEAQRRPAQVQQAAGRARSDGGVLSLVPEDVDPQHPPAASQPVEPFVSEAVQEDIERHIAEASDFGPSPAPAADDPYNPTERPDSAGFGERGGQWEENRFDNPPRLDAGGDLDDNEEESGASRGERDPAYRPLPGTGSHGGARTPISSDRRAKDEADALEAERRARLERSHFPAGSESDPDAGIPVILPPIRQG